MSDSGGISSTIGYDAMGRVTSVENTLPSDGTKHQVLSYGYDKLSRLTSLTGTLDGVSVVNQSYVWDDVSRLTRVVDNLAGKRAGFTWTALGQVATVKRYRDAAGTLLVASSTLGYDQANRLTSLVHALGSAGTTKLTYGLDYDVADRLTQLITPEGASDLSLDHQGQLTGASLTNESYGYDATGNRTGGTVVGADNRLGEDALFTYQYDDEGNLTQRTRKDGSGSDSFSWDHRNRLTSVTRRDGQGNVTLTASYAYDGFDRRIRKTVTGSQNLDQQFFYEGIGDADVLLVADGAGSLTLRQLNAPGTNQALAEDRISSGTTTTRWTLCDHQGSIRDVLENSSAGTVVDHLVYDSFGQIRSETNPNERSFATYTGAPTDAETGLIYLHHRYHDPQTGRWLSQDPIGFAAGDMNLYRYVGNSPLMYVDPSGFAGTVVIPQPPVQYPPQPVTRPPLPLDQPFDPSKVRLPVGPVVNPVTVGTYGGTTGVYGGVGTAAGGAAVAGAAVVGVGVGAGIYYSGAGDYIGTTPLGNHIGDAIVPRYSVAPGNGCKGYDATGWPVDANGQRVAPTGAQAAVLVAKLKAQKAEDAAKEALKAQSEPVCPWWEDPVWDDMPGWLKGWLGLSENPLPGTGPDAPMGPPNPGVPTMQEADGSADSASPQEQPVPDPQMPQGPAAPQPGVPPTTQPTTVPKGSNNRNTRTSATRGSTLHSDKPGNLPDQLRQRYPQTQFGFAKPGQRGQDVQVVGGQHPSTYPESSWPSGVDHADFKPDTPSGEKTFRSDQKNKWTQPTHMLPYNPSTGTLE